VWGEEPPSPPSSLLLPDLSITAGVDKACVIMGGGNNAKEGSPSSTALDTVLTVVVVVVAVAVALVVVEVVLFEEGTTTVPT
jgi:hypothetical protein